jgi:DNA-binding beta-propeller fold protein YncE
MRATGSLAFLVVLVLCACATGDRPAAMATPAAAASPLDPLPPPPPSSALVSPAAPAATGAPTALASASAAGSWPAPLRTLHLEIPAGNSYEPKAMAVHPGLDLLYVRTDDFRINGQGLVTAIDLSTKQVVAVAATAPDAASDGGMAVDTVRHRVYAVNAGMATASVLDARTLATVDTLPDVLLLALDQAGGRLYLAGRESLRVLDVEGLATLAQVSLPSDSSWLALGLNPAAGRLYLAGRHPTGNLLIVYDTADLTGLASEPLNGGPESLVVDSAGGRVYIALNCGSNSLVRIADADGSLLEERDEGRWVGRVGLALDHDGRRLFLAHESLRDHVVTVLDPTTWQRIAAIPLSHSPYSLTWDAHNSRLLVSHPGRNAISIVDVEAGRVAAIAATAIELEDLDVDPARGHVYITDRAGRLRVLHSDTDAELANLMAQGVISIDGPHGRLYTGSRERDVPVRVFDAARMEQTGMIPMLGSEPVADPHSGGLYLVRNGVYIASLETLTVTGVLSDTLPPPGAWNPSPTAVGAVVDPRTGLLFVLMSTGSTSTSGGQYLDVYDPVRQEKVYSDAEISVGYLDVDPAGGRVYVARAHMGYRSISVLEDGRKVAARLDGQFGPLRVDPDLGRLYVDVKAIDQPAWLLVLDAGSLDSLGRVPLPAELTLYALDPQRHLLYLAAHTGEVQIWSAAGGGLPPP